MKEKEISNSIESLRHKLSRNTNEKIKSAALSMALDIDSLFYSVMITIFSQEMERDTWKNEQPALSAITRRLEIIDTEILLNEAKTIFESKDKLSKFELNRFLPQLNKYIAHTRQERIGIIFDNLSLEAKNRWAKLIHYFEMSNIKGYSEDVNLLEEINIFPFRDFPGVHKESKEYFQSAIRRWEREILIPYLDEKEREIENQIIKVLKLPTKKSFIQQVVKEYENEKIKILVNSLIEQKPLESKENIFFEVARNTGKTFEAIKRCYYYPRKKLQK